MGSTESMKERQRRNIAFDILRIIAMLMVTMLHITGHGLGGVERLGSLGRSKHKRRSVLTAGDYRTDWYFRVRTCCRIYPAKTDGMLCTYPEN